MNKEMKIILGVILGLSIFCACICCVSVAGVSLLARNGDAFNTINPQIPWQDNHPWPTAEPDQPAARPTPFSSQPAGSAAAETLSTLEQVIVPINDPVSLAERLKGITDIPETVPLPEKSYQAGDSKSFWITNNDTNENSEIQARLAYLNDVVMFWIEDGVSYNKSDLKILADTFANEIYPINRQFFGSESNPGIDQDPRLVILYTRGLGESVAGYFSSVDSVHPKANPFSNAHEMFVISADNVTLGEDYVYSTFAHEFQHMIHHHLDRNEETWVNEGFSELAAYLNNYDPGGFEYLFIADPDMQLTTWIAIGEGNSGALEATKALAADPENGMEAIDTVLERLGEKDTDGSPLTADKLFADWTIANYLREDQTSDPAYRYKLYPNAPKVSDTEELETCVGEENQRTVSQYGTDYIAILCPGDLTIRFEGAQSVQLLPETPYEGEYAFWSNQGDESDMTLTREFDLTSASAPVSLKYRAWFDLEEDYDYVYVLASTDGKSWEMLRTPSGTDKNPAGSNYGWGYTGDSGGWIDESIDLSDYAGQKVRIRFEYVTDAAVNGRGLLLDDIRMEALDYQTGFENDEGGWNADGFVRMSAALPQTFQVHLITEEDGGVTVQPVALDGGQSGEIHLTLADGAKATLVVSGTTRFTEEAAGYRFSVR